MKNKKGFSLIEVILTIAIMGVLGMLAFTLFGQGLSLYQAETESADLQEDMRLVLSDITNKVRVEDEANIKVEINKLTVGDNVYVLIDKKLYRDSSVIANSISEFDVSIDSGLLKINLKNFKGDEISTSLYLSN